MRSTLKEMVGNGYLVITITPAKGERYQGVVALEGETIAACLENYFMQSEQLPTRLFIRTGSVEGKAAAGGMLLQVLPAETMKMNLITWHNSPLPSKLRSYLRYQRMKCCIVYTIRKK